MAPGDRSETIRSEAQDKLDEFVKRVREAAGPNLESIILFGSAVSGDFRPGLSNLNLFCVLRDSSFAALQASGAGCKVVGSRRNSRRRCA